MASNSISAIRAMTYGGKSKPTGSGLVSRPTVGNLPVRKSRPKRLVTALRRGFGLG